MNRTNFLSLDELRQKAPAAFTGSQAEHLSQQYHKVPTDHVLKMFAERGFLPVSAQQDKPMQRDPRYVRHAVVLRHQDLVQVEGQTVPQILLVNSHNGRTALTMRAGLYRFACANGLVIGGDAFLMRVRHGDGVYELINRYSDTILGKFARFQEIQERWEALELTERQARTFAEAAREFRFGSVAAQNYALDSILEARREEDEGRTLWKVFNRAQENLTQGGLTGVGATGRRVKTRKLTEIGNDIRFNEQLWALGEQFAEAA